MHPHHQRVRASTAESPEDAPPSFERPDGPLPRMHLLVIELLENPLDPGEGGRHNGSDSEACDVVVFKTLCPSPLDGYANQRKLRRERFPV